MAKGKKTGGRTLGTPNKPKSPEEEHLKNALRTISAAYFHEQRKRIHPITGESCTMTDCEYDLCLLAPDDRINAMLRMLEFHTPRMKAVDANINLRGTVVTIEDRLRQLCDQEEE